MTQSTLAAARELSPRGITVNTVSPGLTRTAMLDNVVPVTAHEQLVATPPLNRLGEPEDIAGVVAYLGRVRRGPAHWPEHPRLRWALSAGV